MALDLTKLHHARKREDGAVIAQCPACAGTGGDSNGEHLILFSDGRFGCVAHPGSREHRREILRLAGGSTRQQSGFSRPPAATLQVAKASPPQTLMVLGRLGRVKYDSAEIREPKTDPKTQASEVASTSIEPNGPGKDPSEASEGRPCSSEFLQSADDTTLYDFLPPMQGFSAASAEDLDQFFND
ncbi:hypothetical protein ACXR0O_08715 [Verrucomicrobiota bacterium sgz303538]